MHVLSLIHKCYICWNLFDTYLKQKPTLKSQHQKLFVFLKPISDLFLQCEN
jgi:hypothetical protein